MTKRETISLAAQSSCARFENTKRFAYKFYAFELGERPLIAYRAHSRLLQFIFCCRPVKNTFYYLVCLYFHHGLTC